jgi:pimeloyl-ACP methyl ester carboxylesterase/DNA-binding CsgD family transcriptional regulator
MKPAERQPLASLHPTTIFAWLNLTTPHHVPNAGWIKDVTDREALPRIQYAATPARESVAFCTLGQGPPPLVFLPSGPWTAIAIQWNVPAWRNWDQRLAERHQLIVYDPRGVGFSDPATNEPAFELESQLADLHAVVERLGVERVALLAAQHAGPLAIAFAARHPECVSDLVLWCSYANAAEYFGEARSEVVHQVLDKDWDLFTETIAHAQLGWSESDSAGRLAALLREHLTPEMVASFDLAARAFDVTGMLASVKAPVLVLHRRQLRHPDLAISRRLAATLPGAQLIVLEGDSIAPFVGDSDAAIHAIESFLLQENYERRALQLRTALAEALSERELAVLRLLGGGLSNAEIAHELIISAGTVKTHTAHIYSKLNVDNRTRAVARARELGLLD